MEGGKKGRFSIDVPTLLYVGYIAMFLALMGAAGWFFGLSFVTIAFVGFTIAVIMMIEFTSRLIAEA
jgi:hypothetical protein